jgi:hypothetical protein
VPGPREWIHTLRRSLLRIVEADYSRTVPSEGIGGEDVDDCYILTVTQCRDTGNRKSGIIMSRFSAIDSLEVQARE